MTLRTKLFAVIIAVVSIVVVLCIWASSHFLLKTTTALENGQMMDAIKRVRAVIFSEMVAMSQITRDWASWDDTYYFVENNNENYRKANLTSSLLKDLNANLFVIVDKNGRMIFGRFDPDTPEQNFIRRFAEQWLKKDDALLASPDPKWNGRGMIVFSGYPMLIVSLPILTSENKGPSHGWVIMGRILDAEKIELLGRTAGVTFSVLPLGDITKHPFPGGLVETLTSSANEPMLYDDGKDNIYGFYVEKNMTTKDKILFSVQKERTLYKQARINARYVALWFLLLGVAIVSFSLWLIEKFVLIPLNGNLAKIRHGITGVAASHSLTERIHYSYADEFSEITRAINKMLEELEKAQRANEINRQNVIRLDKLAALGTLVSGIAHEINNPNTVIGVNAEVIADLIGDILRVLKEHIPASSNFYIGKRTYAELSEEIPALLNETKEASRRIAEMIHELKQFSRPSDAVLSYPVFVNEAIRSAVVILRPLISKKTKHLELLLDESVPPIRGNKSHLEQVVVNLLQNALESLQDIEKKVVIMTSFDKIARKISLKIIDEGCGIAEENMTKLTDPFFTTRREKGGTGLGLYVVANIVNEHKGELSFESKLGQGTTVIVLLPAGETENI